MSEIRNCRNFIQVHANIVIIAAKSEASIVITMVGLFPEVTEINASQESCRVSMNMLQDDGSHEVSIVPSVTTTAETVTIRDNTEVGLDFIINTADRNDAYSNRQVYNISETQKCRKIFKVRIITSKVAARSRARVKITVMGLLPESSEVTGNKARVAEKGNSKWLKNVC